MAGADRELYRYGPAATLGPAILRVAAQAAGAAARNAPRRAGYAGHDATAVAILVVEADAALGGALVAQLIADGYRAQLARSAEHARALAVGSRRRSWR